MPETQTTETALQADPKAEQLSLAQTSAPNSDAVLELLRKIQSDTAIQAKNSQKRLLLARINTAVMVLLLVVVIVVVMTVLPKVNETFTRIFAILEDGKTITEQMLDADIPGILKNISQLVDESQSGIVLALAEMQSALQKLQSIDLAGLNAAIASLGSIVAPVARLFGG